jgi:phosphatidylglycerophosphate synthase
MASDALDGFLARTQGQQTLLGRLLDPIADKCLILSTLISCSLIEGLPAWMRIPAWFNLIVISRDILLITGTVVIFATQGRWHVSPSRLGKWAIFAQMLVIPTVLLGLPLKAPLLAAAAALSVASALTYIRLGLRVLH